VFIDCRDKPGNDAEYESRRFQKTREEC